MYGQNPIRKPSDFALGEYRVQEVFHTIQGEGPFAGIPAVFIRFAGCNERCHFCFGWSPGNGREPLVSLLNGAKKKMGDVRIGDKLVSFNLDDGKLAETTVTNVVQQEVHAWVSLKVGLDRYCVTTEHPFLTPRGLVAARNLVRGDEVLQEPPTRKSLQVSDIKIIQGAEKPLPIISLTCAPHPMYLADNFWNHNCDTDFESNWDNVMSAEELVAEVHRVRQPSTSLVVLTGGEPLLQSLTPLFTKLLDGNQFHVQIETAGTTWQPDLMSFQSQLSGIKPYADCFSVVISPKAGKVKEGLTTLASAYKYITAFDNSDPTDGLPNMSTQVPGQKLQLARPPKGVPVYLQPMDVPDAELRKLHLDHTVALCLKHGYRLCLQTHKLVGLP